MSFSRQILPSGFCTAAQFLNVNSEMVLLNMLQLPPYSFSVYNNHHMISFIVK
jgi:hypothetical protein